MIFATVEIIVYPNVHNYKAGVLFFSFTESFGLSGSKTKNIPIASYTFFHSATMSLLSVQFIYRYWAVFNVDKLRCFKGRQAVVWFIYCSFFGFQYAIGTFVFWALDEVSSDYFREEVLLRYNANISSFPAMSIVAYDPVDGSITAPTLILFIPITFIIVLPMFNLDISLPSGVLLCSFTLYPAMDSIIVMCVVSEYRITAKKIFKVIRKIIIEIHKSRNEPTATSSAP
ncbi:hypothetical protein GCK72_026043 [Caenorhabditis remanei]|uniref:Uncharacterized protein n=1 Tax=Caenorhabditis remanei TaxID=31234 RepID=A0A6A5G4E3_CAERE|nr:hypothetical protein GCK72_026043 [Caenorhabditis remanei]KAF1749575.1 hypothetical protein GCK72_026043 [Caenorhabditis remanei]